MGIYENAHTPGAINQILVYVQMNQQVYRTIKSLADKLSGELKNKVDERISEMDSDDKSHYLIYRVLGISDNEGKLIDIYQNKGRFLYNYAGSFLEDAARICFESKYTDAQKTNIANTRGSKPKNFEIDCLIGTDAHEIKWRDATTDGDHITKEHTRVQVIREHGYTPIRVMFYYPQREQAIRIQGALETLYNGIGGKYYYGDAAWQYVKDYTGVDLMEILEKIAESRQQS